MPAKPVLVALAVGSREGAKDAKDPAMRDTEEIARLAVDYGFRIHKDLGPGLLESVYETILAANLVRSGLIVERQKPVDIEYDGMKLGPGFRADLLIEGSLIIEIKSLDRLAPTHIKQLLTYLRLAKLSLGLLMNFGGVTFRDGLKRVVNQYANFVPSRPSREPRSCYRNDVGPARMTMHRTPELRAGKR